MTESNHTPLVTVVIPTYNRMPLIMEAIDSVIAQTYTNWELFVVDDGSTDETVATIKSINDDRINVLELNHVGIVGPLRNAGALAGKGEWISFLDSDDAWKPQKLALQIKALDQSGFECSYTNYEVMDENGNSIPVKAGVFKPFSGWIIREVLTTEAAVGVGALMLSRRLFINSNGFSAHPFLREDHEFAMRLANCTEIIAVPEVLLRVREHTGRGTKQLSASESHELSATAYEIFILGNKEKEFSKIATKQYRQHMMLAAKINFKLGKFWLSFKQLKKLVRGVKKYDHV